MEATVIRSKDFKDTEVIHSLISEEMSLLSIGKETQFASFVQHTVLHESLLSYKQLKRCLYHSNWIRNVK